MLTSQKHQYDTRRGFTLIELSLSIAFIGILSITIALIINDTISVYRNGLTLNQINTTGMDLVDDMRSAIQNSSAKSVLSDCKSLYNGANNDSDSDYDKCKGDGGNGLVSVSRNGKVKVRGNDEEKTVPLYGAFCTGSYSYIWNSGYFFDESRYVITSSIEPAKLKYTIEKDNGSKGYQNENENNNNINFKLLKVQDRTRSVCAYAISDNISSGGPNESTGQTLKYQKPDDIEIGNIFYTSYNEVVEPPVRLLSNDENDTTLALYQLESSKPVESKANNSTFYSVSFILGTIDGGIDITGSNNFCATPADYKDANFDYCAINKFNFAARATGE